jgi:cobalt-zinc-cadmium efflux system membrane fusion protein
VLGKAQGDMVEIASGLEPGVKVACSGAFLFKSDILREKMGAGCAD